MSQQNTATVPDRALVTSPTGLVFAIEVGRRRPIPDSNTEDALLLYNQSRGIQKQLIPLTEDEINKYPLGEEYPPRMQANVFVGKYGSGQPEGKTIIIPDAWQMVTTFLIAYQGSAFSAKGEPQNDPHTGRVLSIRFTAENGQGHCYVLLEKRSAA